MAARLHKARPPRDPEAIPLELRSIPRWVVWDFFPPKPGKTKLGKVPLDPGRDSKADYTNPAAWRSFDDVLAEARRRGDVGVGFVFADSDDVVGVDLDDAYLPTGELKPWAKEILDRLAGTWAEKSVSGSGVHALGLGDRILGKKRLDLSASEGIERYSENRFFTVSGDVIQAAPLADVREAMSWIETRHFRPAPVEREKAIREANRDAAGPYPRDLELDRELARVCLEHLKDNRAHDGDDWRRVGAALKATADDLLDDWVAFSKRWPKCDEEECRDRWRRLVPHPERPATLGSLVHMAGEDSGKAAVDLVREAKARLGRPAGSTGPAPAPKKTAEEIDREERLEAARYGVEASGVLCLVLASDPTLALYRETGLGKTGDVVAVPELTRQDWARITKAFPGARVQLVAGDLGDDAFRSSCRSLLETKSAPEGVVVVGPEAWEGRDDLPDWLDDHGLLDPAVVLTERGRPAARWLADDLLGSISPTSDDNLRREAVDRVLDAVAVCRGPRASLDIEDLLHRASEATGYSREALESLISKARERAEDRRLRDRLSKELERLASSAGDEKVAGEDLLERARGIVDDLTTRAAVVPLPSPFDVAAVEAEARLVRPGFSTGWADLDRARVRLRPKELVGVAARPGQGKTSVLVWLMWKLLEQVDEGAVVFVSHEETKVSILYRLFALASAVLAPEETVPSFYRDSRRWNRGDVRDWLGGIDDGRGVPKEKIELLDRARELVVEKARRLVVIEERGAGADRVAKLCRAIHDAHGCRGVLVDYLQRMPHDGEDLPKGRRDMETAWACRRLRERVAIPFECPVVVAAQVNREALRDGWARRLLEALDPSKKPKRGRGGSGEDDGPDERIRRVERVLAEARPAPHMLRDGGIEHEADLILGTHNPSADMAWDKDKRRDFVDLAWPRNETPLDVGILKNRSGSDGDWIRLVGDYGAGYFVSEAGREDAEEEGLGAVPLDQWNPDANPFA
jgi:replicative DNA helicase